MESHKEFLRHIEDETPGFFIIENQGGMAALRIDPPGKKGRPVSVRDVLARLELFRLSDYDKTEIQSIVEKADGQYHIVCPWHDPERQNASIEIKVTDDKMQAFLIIEKPKFGGDWVSRTIIEDELQKEGIVYGIQNDVINKIISSQPSDFHKSELAEGFLIARGRASGMASHGRIEYNFDPHPRAIPAKEDESNPESRVDFRKLNVIQTCHKGNMLARSVPGGEGTPGQNIYGEILDAEQPVKAEITAGRNTELDEQTDTLYALIDGQVRAEVGSEGRRAVIHVEEILQLEDVDYSTGHVDFPGTVVIEGGIAEGFHVKAAGDIIVDKSVGNVTVQAEGDIILAGGVVGRGQTFIRAGGSVFGRFAQSSSITAGAGIYMEEAIMHCRVVAGNEIIVEAGRGEFIGGQAICGKKFLVRRLGARVETETRVTAGIDPDTLIRFRDIQQQLEDQKRTHYRVETHIRQLEEAKARGKEYEENQEETLSKLQEIRKKVTTVISNLEMQLERIQNSIRPDPEAVVEILETVYPGVEIFFGAGIRRYRVEQRPVTLPSIFYLDDDRVVLKHTR